MKEGFRCRKALLNEQLSEAVDTGDTTTTLYFYSMSALNA
jgi:hypothetical protein